jgi:ribosome-binding factor A
MCKELTEILSREITKSEIDDSIFLLLTVPSKVPEKSGIGVAKAYINWCHDQDQERIISRSRTARSLSVTW